MKTIYIYCILSIFFLSQCKVIQLKKIEEEIRNSYTIKYLNKAEFDKSRKLMFKSLPSSIIINDTIILLERFTSVNGDYSFTLYQSHNKATERHVASKSLKDGKISIDSLRPSNIPDKILPMVQQGKLDEIKQRGKNTTLTPAATLIINIAVKNKERKEFDFTTLVTQEFSTPENY